MDVQAAFAVLLMFAATVNADGEASASFRGSEVTLTCPFDGAWYDKDTKLSETDAYTFQYEVPVQYDCKTSTGRLYQFYVRGLACDNCFELDAFLFIGMVTADVIVSTVLMIIIYRCNRKTSSDAAPHPAKCKPIIGKNNTMLSQHVAKYGITTVPMNRKGQSKKVLH
uniref:CD3 gamma/delta subunit Ig-like domain-containing protein n=1 Tax=Nothobranchius furzeri TaxID=105023 RepID=A0A8C6M6T0_NOTFU